MRDRERFITLTLERNGMIRRWRLLLRRLLLRWRLRDWGSDLWSIFNCIVKVRSSRLKDIPAYISSWMINWCRTSRMMLMMLMLPSLSCT